MESYRCSCMIKAVTAWVGLLAFGITYVVSVFTQNSWTVRLGRSFAALLIGILVGML